MPETLILASRYNADGGAGIIMLSYDGKTLTPVFTDTETENPSFIAFHPTLPLVYAGCENEQSADICVYKLENRRLDLIQSIAFEGRGLCRVAVSPNGRTLAGACYSSGHLLLARLDSEGALVSSRSKILNKPSLAHERQDSPRMHDCGFTNGGLTAAVDFGADIVNLVTREGKKTGAAAFPPGEGPRHIAFHPTAPFAYIITELGSRVYAYHFDDSAAELRNIATYPTIPDGFTGEAYGAELCFTPDGKYLYTSTRRSDNFSVFQVDPGTGELTKTCDFPCFGREPRHFSISQDGSLLAVANQFSGTLALAEIRDGEPAQLLCEYAIPDCCFAGFM